MATTDPLTLAKLHELETATDRITIRAQFPYRVLPIAHVDLLLRAVRELIALREAFEKAKDNPFRRALDQVPDGEYRARYERLQKAAEEFLREYQDSTDYPSLLDAYEQTLRAALEEGKA